MEHFDIVVLGGGCGGLWLLYELALRGFRCVLLEESDKLALFASTRGQNRLHNGSMYLIGTPDPPAAMLSACHEGYSNLLDFCSKEVPDGIASRSAKGVYLYKNQDVRNAILDRIQAAGSPHGLQFRDFSKRNFFAMGLGDVGRIAPTYQYGIETDEYTFRPTPILSRLQEQIQKMGAEFRAIKSLASIARHSQGNTWVTRTDSHAFESAAVVLATGVAAVEQFKWVSGETIDVPADLSPVAVCRRVITERFISFQESAITNFIAMAPYGDKCTLTFGQQARRIDAAIDSTVPFESCKLEIGAALQADLPGFGRGYFDHWQFYGCQKVINSELTSHPISRFGARHYFWVSTRNFCGLYLYSPGKWTMAASAARAFAQHLKEGVPVTASGPRKNPIWDRMELAEPVAIGPATHRIDRRGHFRRLLRSSIRETLFGRSS